MLAAQTPTDRRANLGAVCFSMPADVSSTTRTRPAFPTAYTRIFSLSCPPPRAHPSGSGSAARPLRPAQRAAGAVTEVEADGVIVSAHANRVFRLADLAGLVREWMQAHSVDAVLASSDEALFAISTHETGP